MNNKGFAISTMLYGLIFLTVAIFYMIVGITNSRQVDNSNFIDEIRNELN